LGLGLYGADGVCGRIGGPVRFVGRSRVSTRSHAAFGGLLGSQWGLPHWGAEMAGAFTSPRAMGEPTNDAETLYDIPGAYIAIARSPRDSSSRLGPMPLLVVWGRLHIWCWLCLRAHGWHRGVLRTSTNALTRWRCFGRFKELAEWPSHTRVLSEQVLTLGSKQPRGRETCRT